MSAESSYKSEPEKCPHTLIGRNAFQMAQTTETFLMLKTVCQPSGAS